MDENLPLGEIHNLSATYGCAVAVTGEMLEEPPDIVEDYLKLLASVDKEK